MSENCHRRSDSKLLGLLCQAFISVDFPGEFVLYHISMSKRGPKPSRDSYRNVVSTKLNDKQLAELKRTSAKRDKKESTEVRDRIVAGAVR